MSMIALLTLEEVATHLRVTTKTVYRMLEKHTIPAVKVGRQWRFDKASIDSWLSQRPVLKAARILVIDDDEMVCSLFKDILDGSGHMITTVNESLKGLELVNNEAYDLVFLDLKMPIIDGVELFRQIRQAKPNLPVTIITGYPDSDLMMKALSHGPLGVIKKPFRGLDIVDAVNNYLRFGMPTK
jgi:excisionase family DNA binding protein